MKIVSLKNICIVAPILGKIPEDKQRTAIGLIAKVSAVFLGAFAIALGILGTLDISIFSALGNAGGISLIATGALFWMLAACIEHVRSKEDAEAIREVRSIRYQPGELIRYFRDLLNERALHHNAPSVLKLLKSVNLSVHMRNLVAFRTVMELILDHRRLQIDHWVEFANEFSKLIENDADTPLISWPGTNKGRCSRREAAIIHICLALSKPQTTTEEKRQAFNLLFQAEQEGRCQVQSEACVHVVKNLMMYFQDRTEQEEQALFDNMTPSEKSLFTIRDRSFNKYLYLPSSTES